jgi:CRP-like cAMP-binding protein
MPRKIVFSGGLRFMGLPDIFQLLGGNNCTGTLKLKGPHYLPIGYIYFVNGSPINAINGMLNGVEAINAMFGWTDGTFEFYEEKISVEHSIQTSRMKIVLDALRLLDEGIIKRVGPPTGGFGSFPLSGFLHHYLDGDTAVIKGPPINYVYFIDEEKFSKGDQIVAEGNQCHGLRVILEGAVEIGRGTSNGPVTISRLGEGSFIGTFTSFTYPKSTRTATVTAIDEVYLGRMDYLPLYFEYSSLSIDFRKLLLSLARRLKKISDRLLIPSSYNLHENPSEENETLTTENDLSTEEVFIIREGEAYLFDKTSKSDRPLLKLEKDDVFGSLPFLSLGRESESIKILASKDLEITRLNPEDILREYERLPMVFQNMIHNLSMCIAQTARNSLTIDKEEPVDEY